MKRQRPIKIVFVGGGSVVWAPRIIRDLLAKPCLQAIELVLYDINPAAAERVRRFTARLQEKLGTKALVAATTNQAEAFTDATHYIAAISTGGLDAMAHDLALPEEYNIFHTVGDTSGPGGWARFFRNFPVFVGLAEAIERYSPGAMVLNYTNPMTTLTQVLSRRCSGPVVGLCHGLFENIECIRELYRPQADAGISFRYGGLNHFFWMTEIRGSGIDIFADLRRRTQNQPLSQILDAATKDPFEWASGHEVAAVLFQKTGVLPYVADRHTCEFFTEYITDREALTRFKLRRTTIEDRRKMYARETEKLEQLIREDIPADFLKKSRETASDILEAAVTGTPFIDVGNVPNIGQISNLPLGTVVETDVRVDRNGFTPLAFGALPPTVLPLVQPWAEVFNRSVEAALAGSRNAALAALEMDPVCARLSKPKVRELGTRLLEAHRQYTAYLH